MTFRSELQCAIRGRGELAQSQHGATRRQQRCIPPFVLDAVTDFGDERFLGNGCRSFSFSKRTWKQFCRYMGPTIHSYEKYRNVYLVAAEDGSVITVAWRH
jgi:hypothetical protein